MLKACRLLRVRASVPSFAKLTTNITGLPVVPNSREVLISLFQKLGAEAVAYGSNPYNDHVKRLADYQLHVCIESQTPEEIEEKLDTAHCEILIEQAEEELDLLVEMNEVYRPWEDPDPALVADYNENYYAGFGEREDTGRPDNYIHMSDVLAEAAAEDAAKAAAASGASGANA